ALAWIDILQRLDMVEVADAGLGDRGAQSWHYGQCSRKQRIQPEFKQVHLRLRSAVPMEHFIDVHNAQAHGEVQDSLHCAQQLDIWDIPPVRERIPPSGAECTDESQFVFVPGRELRESSSGAVSLHRRSKLPLLRPEQNVFAQSKSMGQP